MYKKSFVIGVVAASLLLTNQALAHAVVKPNTAGIGKFQSFSLGVPSEKPIATIGIRLVLPDGLNYITPNVKPGWKVNIKKEMTGKEITDNDGMKMPEQKITEISWTGGSIPAGMRDDFIFSAQVPSTPTTLKWKVYQTYADGSVVSWDQDPAQKDFDFSKMGPYSQTHVIDDLTPTTSAVVSSESTPTDSRSTVAIALSAVAILLSLLAFKRNQNKE